jgi:hypothetical protein
MSKTKTTLASHAARFKRSGLTAVEYCRRYAVNLGSLYTFLSGERNKAVALCDTSVSSVQQNTHLTFKQIMPQQTASSFCLGDIDLIFPDGTRAVFPCGFDISDLRKIVEVLRTVSGRAAAC